MGDAGPQTPILVQGSRDTADIRQDEISPSREVNILVTGYGPFKTFTTNPSFLIATSLPESIVPPFQTKNPSSNTTTSSYQPIRTPNSVPYRIKVHVHPEPVRVAYSSTATDIPKLIANGPPGNSSDSLTEEQHALYDYVLHVGMAAGRDNYTLETLAHRDHYKIKDVNDRDGFISGEYEWKRQNLPEVLDVGWHKQDVLSRWEHLTSQAEDKLELREKQEDKVPLQQQGSAPQAEIPAIPNHNQRQQKDTRTPSSSTSTPKKRLDVKISRDAGRFLCEFILYTSLAHRYKEAQEARSQSQSQSSSSFTTTEPSTHSPSSSSSSSLTSSESPLERLGKVAFLHVPGGLTPLDIEKGTLVAEAAITALVTSWESGFRNSNVYKENGAVKV